LNYIDNTLKVTVIDVGQGDSIFIKLPNNQGNLLIDTGGIISYDTEKWKPKAKQSHI
jgi:competence protein ComEC